MKRERRDQGQGLLEFALILPVLLIVAFGVLDLGRAFHAVVVINNASRVGARYLTTHPILDYPNFTGTRQAAVDEVQNSFININTSDVSVVGGCIYSTATRGCQPGAPITVQVSYDFELITGWFLPSPITLTRSTKMMVP